MKFSVVKGLIKRRMLINFRVDADVIQEQLPSPFRPKLQAGYAIAGICLIRLEQLRPAGFPAALGLSSENAAHRVAVTWEGADGQRHEGVFIRRRDTDSKISHFGGGLLFPGEHQLADFEVKDEGMRVDFAMKSRDATTSIRVQGIPASGLPASSCFRSLHDSSRFFESGSQGYSVTRKSDRFDGIQLITDHWRVEPLAIQHVDSSFFADTAAFPKGSIVFDHALIMRDIPHEWHASKRMKVSSAP